MSSHMQINKCVQYECNLIILFTQNSYFAHAVFRCDEHSIYLFCRTIIFKQLNGIFYMKKTSKIHISTIKMYLPNIKNTIINIKIRSIIIYHHNIYEVQFIVHKWQSKSQINHLFFIKPLLFIKMVILVNHNELNILFYI